MKPQTPAISPDTDPIQHSLNTTTHRVLSGNVSPGNGLTFDANGQPLTFSADNTVGKIFRIGSQANPLGQVLHWPGSNTDFTFNHNLNAIPYGYIVIAKSGACDVYWGSLVATKNTITLRTTDGTQDVTIWLLV